MEETGLSPLPQACGRLPTFQYPGGLTVTPFVYVLPTLLPGDGGGAITPQDGEAVDFALVPLAALREGREADPMTGCAPEDWDPSLHFLVDFPRAGITGRLWGLTYYFLKSMFLERLELVAA